MSPSRREFLGQVGAAAILPRFLPDAPELVLHNGRILTMNPAQPTAQAIAVAGGRILAVGSDDDILGFARPGTRRVDLGGQRVVPGFNDAHSHPASAGLQHLRAVDCDLRSIPAIQQAIRERAARTAPGQWVLGFKYDDTKTAEGRYLTIADLDAAATAHPVYVVHRGGHTAYVNSMALRLAGVTDQSPDPQGGRYERDAGGRLTGRVAETGQDAFNRVIPENYTREDRQAGVKLISQMLARSGITSVTDAEGTLEDFRAYQDALHAGELGTRVYCGIYGSQADPLIAASIRTGFGDEWLRVGFMKLVCDGSISERTARLSQPYVGRPDDFGILVASADELYPQVRKAHDAGWQVGIHANGDVAIDLVLGIYERIQREAPRADARYRLEHCTVINDGLVRRIKALGAIPTPFSTYVYFHGEKMKEYGADRLNSMFALRSFIDAGIPATLASDYPPGPFEPMMALQSAVTRTDMKGTVWGPKQRITVEEALRAFTVNGAHASFEERSKGTLEEGKLADLVVLGRDPLREDPSTLVTIPIERTMVGGRWVYES
jgi:predicted amidohydrolase YtcJ